MVGCCIVATVISQKYNDYCLYDISLIILQIFQIPTKQQFSLLQFQMKVVDGLLNCGKTISVRQRGRPSSSAQMTPPVSKRGRKPEYCLPQNIVRYDSIGHWPVFSDDQRRCCFCSKGSSKPGYSSVKCEKCDVYLCLVKHRNCFNDFHKSNCS